MVLSFNNIFFTLFIIFNVNGVVLDYTPTELQQCVETVVEKLFSNTSGVYVIQDDQDYDLFVGIGTVKHVFVDVTKPMYGFSQYGKDFFIQAKTESSLKSSLNAVRKNTIWNDDDPTVQFLIVTQSQNISEMFNILWNFNIVNVLIISEDGEKFNVYSSDPFHLKNNCGKNASEYVAQQCSSNLTIDFPRPIRNLNGCPIMFIIPGPKFPSMVLNRLLLYLERALNVTAIKFVRNQNDINILINWVNNNSLIVNYMGVPPRPHLHEGNLMHSYEIFREYMVWVSPVERQTFNLKVIASLFQYEIWILVALVSVIVTLIWGFILKITKSHGSDIWGYAFINMCSLLVCGCISRIPSISTTLRGLVLLFLFYVIIIQTAFTANLITALTSEIDVNKIETVEDVAISKLPVCTTSDVIQCFFSGSKPNDEVYMKIKSKLLATTNCIKQLNTSKCICLIYNAELIVNNKYFEASVVSENKYTTTGKMYLASVRPHYMMSSVNEAIRLWKESGIFDIDYNTILSDNKSVKQENNEPQVLTLEHFSGTFAIWGIGMAFSILVFIMEIVVYKFSEYLNAPIVV